MNTPAVCGRQIDVEHLYGLEFLKEGSRRQPRGVTASELPQGCLQAVCDKRDEDMGFYAIFLLMEYRANREITLQILKGLHKPCRFAANSALRVDGPGEAWRGPAKR